MTTEWTEFLSARVRIPIKIIKKYTEIGKKALMEQLNKLDKIK